MMFHSPFTSSNIIYAILCLLAASVSLDLPLFVAATNITTDDLYSKISPTAAAPGFNVEGGSVFTNLANTINAGQLFWLRSGSAVQERPDAGPVQPLSFTWCSDLTFSDLSNSSLMGYAGRCVRMYLGGYEAILAGGAQLPFEYSKGRYGQTGGISAVFVEQQNVFEGEFHADIDDWVYRYWDDGSKTAPYIGWEGHDEGDMSPNAATSSHSGFGKFSWMSVEEAAQLYNTSVDEFTPETFKQVYYDTWIRGHEFEAVISNPNPLPELEIIEQVKNETNYVDDTAPITPVEPDSPAEDGSNCDGANPVEDDSGSGRKLASIAARFVSAALRVFGI